MSDKRNFYMIIEIGPNITQLPFRIKRRFYRFIVFQGMGRSKLPKQRRLRSFILAEIHYVYGV